MPSKLFFWVRLAGGLALAVVVPPALVVANNQSVPVRVEWWMIAAGAVGILVAPGPRARLLLLLPYALVMGLVLMFVAMRHACSLGFCV